MFENKSLVDVNIYLFISKVLQDFSKYLRKLDG